MASLSVEIEVTAAEHNGSDALACTFVYRLINEDTQNVLTTKTVDTEISDSSAHLEVAEILRDEMERAMRWAQWVVLANKAPQYVGAKKRVRL